MKLYQQNLGIKHQFTIEIIMLQSNFAIHIIITSSRFCYALFQINVGQYNKFDFKASFLSKINNVSTYFNSIISNILQFWLLPYFDSMSTLVLAGGGFYPFLLWRLLCRDSKETNQWWLPDICLQTVPCVGVGSPAVSHVYFACCSVGHGQGVLYSYQTPRPPHSKCMDMSVVLLNIFLATRSWLKTFLFKLSMT